MKNYSLLAMMWITITSSSGQAIFLEHPSNLIVALITETSGNGQHGNNQSPHSFNDFYEEMTINSEATISPEMTNVCCCTFFESCKASDGTVKEDFKKYRIEGCNSDANCQFLCAQIASKLNEACPRCDWTASLGTGQCLAPGSECETNTRCNPKQ